MNNIPEYQYPQNIQNAIEVCANTIAGYLDISENNIINKETPNWRFDTIKGKNGEHALKVYGRMSYIIKDILAPESEVEPKQTEFAIEVIVPLGVVDEVG